MQIIQYAPCNRRLRPKKKLYRVSRSETLRSRDGRAIFEHDESVMVVCRDYTGRQVILQRIDRYAQRQVVAEKDAYLSRLVSVPHSRCGDVIRA